MDNCDSNQLLLKDKNQNRPYLKASPRLKEEIYFLDSEKLVHLSKTNEKTLLHILLKPTSDYFLSDSAKENLCLKLGKMKGLRKLHLNLKRFGDKVLQNLAKGLKHNKSMRSLNLSCSKDIKEREQKSPLSFYGIETLLRRIKYLPQLQFISFSFPNKKGIEEIPCILKVLKSVKNLKTLELVFFDRKETFENVWSGIKRLKNLCDLRLHFLNCYGIDKMSLQSLLSEVKNHPNLKSLTLGLVDCLRIRFEAIEGLSEELKTLRSLLELNLTFNFLSALDIQGLKALCSGLELQHSLLHLKLEISNCYELDNQAVEQFGTVLTNYNNLESLSLSLSRICITDLMIAKLFSSMKFLVSLEELKLDFSGYQSEEFGVVEEFLELPVVTVLALQFPHFFFRNNNIGGLCGYLERLKSLSELTLSFQTPLDGIKILTTTLALLKALIKLKLCLANSSVNDAGVEFISYALESLQQLNHLTLNFENTISLTNKGVISLSKGLKNLNSLSRFKLNINGCLIITEDGLGMLFEKLSNLSKLWLFKLSMLGCRIHIINNVQKKLIVLKRVKRVVFKVM